MKHINICFLFFALCFSPSLVLAEALELTTEQLANLELKTVTIESREASPTLKLTGMLKADRRKAFHIAPVVDGVVVKLEVVEHDQVRKGQTLARFHSNALGQAQANYLGALTHFNFTKTERARIQALWTDGVVPESRWLKTDSEYMSARASLDQAQRLLSLTGLSQDRIRDIEKNTDALAYFSLISPVDGIVMDAKIETGQMIENGESAFRVVDISSLWVDVQVPAASLSQVAIGAETLVRVTAYPGRSFKGMLQSLGGEVDEDSQTLKGRIVLENQEALLRPGMYAQIALLGVPQQGLMVPTSAVFYIGDQTYVFKVSGDRRFEPLSVEIGSNNGDWVPVSGEALAAGVKIVTKGLAELKSHWLYQGGE